MTEKQSIYLIDAMKRPASMMLTGAVGDLLPAAFFLAEKLLETEPGKLNSHPDFYMLSTEEEKMGVEEAMLLVKRAGLKAVRAENTVIIVDGFDKFTEAAQNKLLLSIEEGKAIFLVTVSTNHVLDTVKSRLRKLVIPKSTMEDYSNQKDGELMYVLTEGCLSILEERKKYLPLMKELAGCIEKKAFLEIFKLLHLVKEKDAENFYEKEGMEGVKILYRFYSYIFLKWLVYLQTGKQECSFCKFGEENLQVIMQYAKHINDHAAMLASRQYTKEHLFLLFAEALCLFEKED
ncbi:MAG: hypothetical protein IJN92_00385 [Lachnospiraceae bacterium]|nr:hypothetical protein [Lachnospiraceae bacterium]